MVLDDILVRVSALFLWVAFFFFTSYAGCKQIVIYEATQKPKNSSKSPFRITSEFSTLKVHFTLTPMTSSVFRKPGEPEAPKKEGGNRRVEVLTMSFVVVVFWNVLVCWGSFEHERRNSSPN